MAEKEAERKKKRAREGYTGSGTALPQGRTPNLGHNYTEADVARPFPRRRLGAAVTLRDYSRFRNNNYLILEVHNPQPGWNAGSNRWKERKTGSLSVHLVTPSESNKKCKNIICLQSSNQEQTRFIESIDIALSWLLYVAKIGKKWYFRNRKYLFFLLNHICINVT